MNRLILIYPSARPSWVRECIERTRRSTAVPLQIALGLTSSQEDFQSLSSLADLSIHLGTRLGDPPYTASVNMIMRAAVNAFKPQDRTLIGYWSDDFHPLNKWADMLLEARNSSQSHIQLCPHNSIQAGRTNTQPFSTWAWWRDRMGGLMWPPMYRYLTDVEPTEKAKALGEFLYLRKCVIKHAHYVARTRQMDAIDKFNSVDHSADSRLLDERRKLGWPVTWNEVIP